MEALTWEETAPLGEALSHPSPAVRLAALRALIRLPLETAIWLELSAYTRDLLERQPEPEGEGFHNQTLNGIPFKEVLDAAVFIPTRSIREQLYGFLSADDPEIRAATARALAAARDPAAVKQFVWEIEDPVRGNLEDTAEWLSLLDVSAFVGEVGKAYDRAKEPDTRFWFALALAKAGTALPLESVLADLTAEKIELHNTWGDPTIFTDKLRLRGPFPENIRKILKKYASLEEPSSLVPQIAADLYWAGQPAEEAPPETPGSRRSLDNPELLALGKQVTSQLQEQGELDEETMQKAFQPELMPYVPADVASQLVTALFGQVLHNPAFGFIGNGIVLAVYEVQSAFTPDIAGLFQLYSIALKNEEAADGFRPPWGFRWQIAWTVSRASFGQVLTGLTDPLRSGNEPQMVLAARLIEDSALYRGQDFPPIFGGGSQPADLVPGSELIDDEGHGGEMHAANGGDGGPGEGIETGSISGETLEDLTAEESDKGIDEPKTRGFGFVEQPEEEEDVFEGPSVAGDPRYSFDLGDFGFEEGESEADGPQDGEEVLEGLPPKAPIPRERNVNTGFSPVYSPDSDLDKHMPLKAGGTYYFWLSIGKRDIASLETRPTPQISVPMEAKVTVALFGFADGLILTSEADFGELKERGGKAMQPSRQPLGDQAPQSEKAAERLYFPIQAPSEPGEYRMRCNLYWGQILLQSRLVEAVVEIEPVTRAEGEAVLRVTADYSIAPSLDPSHLRQLPEHRLSVLMNQNPNGTHSFHFKGAENGREVPKKDVRFGESELQDMITTARKKLRRVSWNTEDEWRDMVKDPYRYRDREIKIDRLKTDLINLAQWGYPFYERLSERLAGPGGDDRTLQKLMKKPGNVQIALKEDPSYILPVSLIYDYDLDVGADLSLCQTFEMALERGQALETTACFQGDCPSTGDITVVCPSGFWGFRHYLGTPLTVVKSRDEANSGSENGGPNDIPATIEVQGALRVAASVATNLDFTETHIEKIRQLRAGTVVDYADTRKRVFEVLKGTPHLVYFYCHGGYTGSAPYLQVGEDNSQIIDPSNIKAYHIRWDTPRPLVFLNGCHTTSVAPMQALQFISPFVTRARSAGVIGTEITIFEELATTFAEACLSRFYAGETIGEAIRNARLVLLQEGNPLGLVYIPFVIAGLRLVEKV